MDKGMRQKNFFIIPILCMTSMCMANNEINREEFLVEQSLKRSIEHYSSKPFFKDQRNLEYTYEIWSTIIKPSLELYHVNNLKMIFIWLDSSTLQDRCWLISESIVYEISITNKDTTNFTIKERKTPISIFSIIDKLKEDTANLPKDQLPLRSSGNAIFLYIFPEREKGVTCIFTTPPHSYQKSRMKLHIDFLRCLGKELPFMKVWEEGNKSN